MSASVTDASSLTRTVGVDRKRRKIADEDAARKMERTVEEVLEKSRPEMLAALERRLERWRGHMGENLDHPHDKSCDECVVDCGFVDDVRVEKTGNREIDEAVRDATFRFFRGVVDRDTDYRVIVDDVKRRVEWSDKKRFDLWKAAASVRGKAVVVPKNATASKRSKIARVATTLARVLPEIVAEDVRRRAYPQIDFERSREFRRMFVEGWSSSGILCNVLRKTCKELKIKPGKTKQEVLYALMKWSLQNDFDMRY